MNNALKEAMKAKNERTVSTLRMVNSTLKNADIEARSAAQAGLGRRRGAGYPAEDDQAAPGIRVEMYKKGARPDLVQQEEERDRRHLCLPAEADVQTPRWPPPSLSLRLPRPAPPRMKDMGKVIGVLRAKYAGQMDFGKASGVVKAKLQ